MFPTGQEVQTSGSETQEDQSAAPPAQQAWGGSAHEEAAEERSPLLNAQICSQSLTALPVDIKGRFEKWRARISLQNSEKNRKCLKSMKRIQPLQYKNFSSQHYGLWKSWEVKGHLPPTISLVLVGLSVPTGAHLIIFGSWAVQGQWIFYLQHHNQELKFLLASSLETDVICVIRNLSLSTNRNKIMNCRQSNSLTSMEKI